MHGRPLRISGLIVNFSLKVHLIILANKYFITIYHTPTHREGAILQSPCPSVHTFVKDVSALLEEMILLLIHDFGRV
jgi:hypothetical protein